MIAHKMKDDIHHVRDEWQTILSEKELELKKLEASESLRIKNHKSELILQHQKQILEQESLHNGAIARIQNERDEIQSEYSSKLTQMISIDEHEAILNTELQKATESATGKLDQIQSTLGEHMQKALQERLSEQEKNSELVLLQSQQTFMNEKDDELEKCSQMHSHELRDKVQQHQHFLEDLQERFKMQVVDYE